MTAPFTDASPVSAPVTAPVSELEGGFAETSADAARAFRALLDALSRPGLPQRLTGAQPPQAEAPASSGSAAFEPTPFGPAAGTLALTLCDAETPVWLAPALRGGPVEAWLRFHANTPFAATPAEAAFAFAPPETLAEILDDLPFGTPEYPDRSATLVCLLADLSGPTLRATGPGVETSIDLAPGAARALALTLSARNRALFPQGNDLFLVAGETAVGLPRTTRLSED